MSVESVNVYEGYVLMESGEIAEIDTMLDCEGDYTDEPDDACAAIAPLSDGTWLSVDLRQFEPVSLH